MAITRRNLFRQAVAAAAVAGVAHYTTPEVAAVNFNKVLDPGVSFLVSNGQPVGAPQTLILAADDSATFSAASVVVPPPPPPPSSGGVLISKAEVLALPTSGSAYSALTTAANAVITPTLSDQDSPANVRTFAAALVAVRTNSPTMRAKVVAALRAVKGTETGRALALGRELGAYVIAADLIGATDAEVGYDFKAWLRGVVVKQTTEAGSLVDCMRNRPNNWGAHAAGALACAYAYLGDTAGLAEVAKVAKGWAGDRSAYAGFTYGDLSWQADSAHPVGVNPKGAVKSGMNIDGAQPDDLRRGGSFPTIGADGINYSWEALQGQLLKALVLARHGYPDVIEWSDRALLRAVDFNYAKLGSASGDDTWQPWAFRKLYGSAFSHPLTAASSGKNLGYTDWLYG